MSTRNDVGNPGSARDETGATTRFVQVMRTKLRENSHKGGWAGIPVRVLLGRLRNELGELEAELGRFERENMFGTVPPEERGVMAEQVAREAADLANFAMMIADNVGGLARVG